MDFSSIKSITILEGKVKKILSATVVLWQALKNWARYSTESDGVTIYNGGLGYKDGYRVRSGGAETVSTYTSCTGYIPVKAGDSVRFGGWDAVTVSSSNAINVADADHNNLGQIVANNPDSYGVFLGTGHNWDDVIQENDSVWCWVVPDGYNIAYIRVTGFTNGDGSKMIVTVNEEIT